MTQKLILIGASTGGPGHIKKLLKEIKLNGASVVIAQHMNKMFLPSFATQVGKECGVDVRLLEDKIPLQENTIYICNRNFIISDTLPLSAKPNGDEKTTYNPNVDILFLSGVTISKSVKIMAILLTGIGDDGAKGLSELCKAGVKCIAESEESAIVYGMPKRAKELNSNIKSLPLLAIKKELEEFLYVL